MLWVRLRSFVRQRFLFYIYSVWGTTKNDGVLLCRLTGVLFLKKLLDVTVEKIYERTNSAKLEKLLFVNV